MRQFYIFSDYMYTTEKDDVALIMAIHEKLINHEAWVHKGVL